VAGAVTSLVSVKPALGEDNVAWLVAVTFWAPAGAVGLAVLQL
jgi:hypothetical protein